MKHQRGPSSNFLKKSCQNLAKSVDRVIDNGKFTCKESITVLLHHESLFFTSTPHEVSKYTLIPVKKNTPSSLEPSTIHSVALWRRSSSASSLVAAYTSTIYSVAAEVNPFRCRSRLSPLDRCGAELHHYLDCFPFLQVKKP
jgi:hypothetical protein